MVTINRSLPGLNSLGSPSMSVGIGDFMRNQMPSRAPFDVNMAPRPMTSNMSPFPMPSNMAPQSMPLNMRNDMTMAPRPMPSNMQSAPTQNMQEQMGGFGSVDSYGNLKRPKYLGNKADGTFRANPLAGTNSPITQEETDYYNNLMSAEQSRTGQQTTNNPLSAAFSVASNAPATFENANYQPNLGELVVNNPNVPTSNMITTSASSTPYSGQRPYIDESFAEARRLYETGGPKGFGRSTIADFSGPTESALQSIENTAMAGSPNIGIGQNLLGETLSGDFLNSNPYLDQMYNQAADNVTRNYREAIAPSIGANAEAQGRFGSGLYQNMMANSQRELGDSLGRLATNVYGQNYATERGRQDAALGKIPSMAGMNYFDASQLLGAGEIRDTNAQNVLSDQYNQYMFDQNRPGVNFRNYQNAISGNFGGTNVMNQPDYANPTASNIGGGLGVIGGLMDLYSNYKKLGT